MEDVKYYLQYGEFFVKGSIDFGITGIHANETFDDDMISIMYCSYDELCTALETGDDFFFEPILPYLQKAERSEEGFAKALESYYNDKLEELQKNIYKYSRKKHFLLCRKCFFDA